MYWFMFLKSKFWIIIFLCLGLSAQAQESFRVMFYNVENLFDTKDDKHKNDNDFLPQSSRKWTYNRYKEKLNHIAKTIIASGNSHVPDLVGLCEVENDVCMRDLIKYSPLREADYRYVMTDSPDERGIDVALIYQRHSFKLLGHRSISVPIHKLKRGHTRDILHVTGKVLSGDTLDVFVVHYPSRNGGQKKSEPYRLLVSQTLNKSIVSLKKVRKNPHIVVMGDFNDYPKDPSLKELKKSGLHNMMESMKSGSYKYNGKWEIIDQILVSDNLLKRNNSIRTSNKHVKIIRLPFTLEEDNRYGGDKPFRTYNGMKYQGGYSDHLPVCLDLDVFTRDDKDYYLK